MVKKYLKQSFKPKNYSIWVKSCIFALNFSPYASYEGYSFNAPEGEWELIFDSDDKDYDGFSRLKNGERHWSDGKMSVYLPCRCAFVLRKVEKL